LVGKTQIKFPRGIRLIKEDDIRKHIKSFVPEMDKFTLEDYYKWSLEENSLVIVREMEENIAGVLWLTVHNDYIMIETVVRNKELAYSKGAGGDLVKAVETVITRYYQVKEIRLEAMEQVVDYYKNILKYEKYDQPYQDPNWGTLTPMKKRLVPS
jgi:hypothetical protein